MLLDLILVFIYLWPFPFFLTVLIPYALVILLSTIKENLRESLIHLLIFSDVTFYTKCFSLVYLINTINFTKHIILLKYFLNCLCINSFYAIKTCVVGNSPTLNLNRNVLFELNPKPTNIISRLKPIPNLTYFNPNLKYFNL